MGISPMSVRRVSGLFFNPRAFLGAFERLGKMKTDTIKWQQNENENLREHENGNGKARG